ncbi:M15 family metallopeptidase [Nocardioides sambongensis]|uniref:M15 family metallopeptidase n=1 Tax=Nocardioides sambongensis TaxID=2589074 RepID=UPI00112EBD6D|nr:M15 family metallopeptidase [Nocardioides sambongensis]
MGLARRRARTAAAVLAVGAAAVLAGCGADSGPPGGSEASTEPAATDSSAPPISTAADPAHAVAAPGPLDTRLYGDDLLVVSDDTLSAELIDQIEAIEVGRTKGVEAAEPLSYAQFTVENKLYNIAAVDPAGYRAFTGQDSAEWQEQWERIAGGEIAVRDTLRDRMPVDEDGFLEVGSGKTTYRIHVGAWSPAEVDVVDAMVNDRWGEELGMPEGNALLINTGLASPQDVREEIEKLEDLSVTALDIVAQSGIDPDTYQTVIPVGSFADAVGVFRYTPIGGGRVEPDPAWVASHIVTEQMPILGSMTCNKHMMPQLRAALLEIQQTGLADEINPDEYAGCYYPRFIAGSTTLSNHSYGLAIDINTPGNQRGTVGDLDRGVVAIFKKWGFAWGGDWSYTDPMHFELDHIVEPG